MQPTPVLGFLSIGSVPRFFATSSLRTRKCRRVVTAIVLGSSAILALVAVVNGDDRGPAFFMPFIPNERVFPNPAGASQTYSTIGGGIDQTGPFFQSLGTNGRSCGTCHQPSDGMSVSAVHVQERFRQTEGLDPIFRMVDGSNCNHGVDVSTLEGRSQAYSLLRTRGLIRVAIAVPANADYEVASVDNQLRLQRNRRDLDVPTAAAKHQPAFLERGHG